MILRRFMQHIKEQNWFAVGLDVLVVIVGIFLGLQVQAAYEERAWQAQEKVILQSLYNDMLENKALTEERMRTAAEDIKMQSYTAQILTAGDIPAADDQKAIRAVQTSTFLSPLRLNVDTYESIVQTGEITRISNDEVRTSLYELDRQITFFINQQQYLRSYTTERATSINDVKGWRYDNKEDRYVAHINFEPLLGNDEKLNSLMSMFRTVVLFQRDRLRTIVIINELLALLEAELGLEPNAGAAP